MISEIYRYIFRKSAMLLNRNQLGSIELKKAPEWNKEQNAKIATSFKIIEQSINSLIVSQQEYMARECENEQQLLFGRGTTNGLILCVEELEKMKSQHEEDTKGKEPFNKFKVT